MTSPLDNAIRRAVLGVGVFVLCLGGLVADRMPALALVNESSSLPRGLYLRDPGAVPGRGVTVALAQPGSGRTYLRTLGMPAEVLLIKRVAAVGGDRVCRRGDEINVAGRRLPVRDRDRRGAVLPQWRDCRRLGQGELFLLGDTAGSFDSRYFGPVRRDEVEGVFQESLTW